MGVLGSIVQPLVRSMLYVLHHLLLRRFVTLEFVGDDDPWHEALFFEEFAKESLCRLRIPMPLQQNFQDFSLRIHCSPQVVLLLFERHHHFIQMPFISDERTFPTKLIGLLLPEFLAPLPHRFIGEFDAAIQHYLLNVPVAQRKGVVEPDTAANNFAGKFRTGVHEPGIMSEVEPGRLFYLWVKLTIPVYPTRSTGKIVCPTARSSDGLILQGGDRGIEQS